MSNTSEPPSADPSSGGPSHGREGGGAAAGPQAPWEPIFSTPGSDIVPGELLLTLTPPATQALTRSIPLHPLGPATAGVAELGVGELDEVLADLGVRDVVRMALPSTGIAGALDQPATGRLQEADEPLSRSFRVRVATDTELEAAAERLRGLGAVENAEPNRYRETLAVPNDPEYGQQWGLPKINAPAAWDRTTGDSTVVVAVIDSGCDLDHPELAPLLVPGYDMVDLGTNPTPPAGFVFEGDFSGRDDVPEDEVGHGTHVAGTIAALSNNAAGVAGVTWNCRIMPVKALTRIRRIAEPPVVVRGVGSSADVAAAVRWAADHGASVINMSLGSPSPTSLEQSAVAYAIGKGCVVVAAMGNTGTSDPSYPAAYPDVVSVGAIDSADARASFSQTGGHIDVVAPGVGIRSTYLDGGFATLNGTSMASPHVAGVAALIRSVKPTATVAEVTDILRTTARPLRDAPADPVPNDRYGHGCVDAQAAVSKAAPIVLPPLTVFAPCFPRTPFTPCLPRTPILPCLPRTPFAPCLEIRTPLLPCPTIPTTFPPTTFPPTTTFPPPTLPTTFPPTFPPTTPPPTGPFGPGQGGAGGAYDPFGMTGYQAAYGTGAAGGQAGSAAGGVTGVGATGPGAGAAGGTGAAGPAAGASAGGGQESYEAGYAAGYAAAYAEMAGGGGTAAGPGTAEIAPSVLCPIITRPFPIRTPLLPCLPDTVLLRDCWFPRSPLWRCPPPTVLEPHCFEVTPPTQTFPTTPITNPGGPGGPGGFGGGYGGYGGGYGGYGYGGYGGGGYGGDGGYDPYGRSPFGA